MSIEALIIAAVGASGLLIVAYLVGQRRDAGRHEPGGPGQVAT